MVIRGIGFAVAMDIVYSSDDGGFYAEVVDRAGATLHTTEVVSERKEAARLAHVWSHENHGFSHLIDLRGEV